MATPLDRQNANPRTAPPLVLTTRFVCGMQRRSGDTDRGDSVTELGSDVTGPARWGRRHHLRQQGSVLRRQRQLDVAACRQQDWPDEWHNHPPQQESRRLRSVTSRAESANDFYYTLISDVVKAKILKPRLLCIRPEQKLRYTVRVIACHNR